MINLYVCVHQEILTGASGEAERWRSLYEDLEQKSVQLRKNQNLKEDQLQRLQSQVEVPHSPIFNPQADSVRPPGSHLEQHLCSVQLSRTGETRLREEVESLRQQRQELQYDVLLLEEDNQVLREEIQQLRGELARLRLLTDVWFFWFPTSSSVAAAAFAR